MGINQQFARLSPREKEVVRRMLEYQRPDEITEGMSITKRTLEWHIRRLRLKLGITGIGTTEKTLRRLYSEASNVNLSEN